MIFVLFSLTFLGSIKLYTTHSACPTGWQGDAALSACYLYHSGTKQMNDARKYCYENHKAVLAMPKTEQENNFLRSMHTTDIFLGMTDNHANGHWEYLDGDDVSTAKATFSYDPWSTNPGPVSQNCVAMIYNGDWIYVGCDHVKAFVCEKDFSITDSCIDQGWYMDPYYDMCYKLFGEGTYLEALYTCGAEGYDILMPKIKRQHRFIQWILETYIACETWIGYTDLVSEGYFRWQSGSNPGFTAFSYGSPNDLSGDQDCARYDNIFGDYEWNDWTCTSIFPKTVCQESASAFSSGGDVTTSLSTLSTSTVYTTDITTDVITTDLTTDIPTDLTTDLTTDKVTTDFNNDVATTDLISTMYTQGFCPCACVNTTLSTNEIMLYIAKLQKELKVDVETLSSTIRARTCAEDPRQSARNIGIVGVVVLTSVFSLIIFMDIISFVKVLFNK